MMSNVIRPLLDQISEYCDYESKHQFRVTSKQMADVVTQDESKEIKRRHLSSRNNQFPLALSSTDRLYCFGADKAGFRNKENFQQFCQMCDPVDPIPKVTSLPIRPATIQEKDPMCNHTFEFKNGQVIFTTSYNPLETESNYCHYFGITGERQLLIKLRKFFMENCQWDEICHGSRDFS